MKKKVVEKQKDPKMIVVMNIWQNCMIFYIVITVFLNITFLFVLIIKDSIAITDIQLNSDIAICYIVFAILNLCFLAASYEAA